MAACQELLRSILLAQAAAALVLPPKRQDASELGEDFPYRPYPHHGPHPANVHELGLGVWLGVWQGLLLAA